jgi:hypothetical protein
MPPSRSGSPAGLRQDARRVPLVEVDSLILRTTQARTSRARHFRCTTGKHGAKRLKSMTQVVVRAKKPQIILLPTTGWAQVRVSTFWKCKGRWDPTHLKFSI